MQKRKNSFFRRNWRSIFAFVTYITDSAAIFGCGISVWYLLFNYYSGPVLTFGEAVPLIALIWVMLSFFALVIGLYRQSYPANSSPQFLMAAKTYVYGIPFILTIFYLLHMVHIPRSYLILYLFLLPLHFLLGRGILSIVNSILQELGLGIYNVLVVLHGKISSSLPAQLANVHTLGYNVIGLVSQTETGPVKNGNFLGKELPIFGFSDLDQIIQDESIDRVFIPSTSFVVNGFHQIVEKCRNHQVKLKIVSPEASSLLRMARVYDIAGITLYTPFRRRLEFVKRILKRGFDFIGSLLLIVLLSPIYLVTSIAIYLESGWPVVYTQWRSSIKGGKKFKFLKFRSMIHDAEKIREHLTDLNEATGALFKMKNDPRMTRIGRYIRKFSIDELPQLFNVLRGDMSLVGPRPLPIEDFQKVSVGDDVWDAISDRAKVKPGITGLWQISGRSDLSFNEMVLLDLYYVEHQSLLFDIEILFETAPAVLFGRGAY
jgi:exopolysaccharide biosynthesis polyprenyl glycosylphosphotransferase